jgi:hypothetical protein
VVDVFVERALAQPATEHEAEQMVSAAQGCFALHGVQWHESVLAANGRSMICRFTAVDAESVRIALRQAGVRFESCRAG